MATADHDGDVLMAPQPRVEPIAISGSAFAAATATTARAAPGPFCFLSADVVRDIFLTAVRIDPQTGCVLSGVSRGVYELLAAERRKTQVLTSPRALQAFWARIEHEQLLPILAEWRLPVAFADVLTIRLDEATRELQDAGVPVLTERGQPHPILAGRHAVPPAAKRLLETRFGCSASASQWARSGQPESADVSSFTADSLYPLPPPTPPKLTDVEIEEADWRGENKPLGPAVENLFIDIGSEPESSTSWSASSLVLPSPRGIVTRGGDADDAEEAAFGPVPARGTSTDPFTLVERLDNKRQRISAILSSILEDKGAPWHLVQKMHQLPARHGRSMAHLLEHLPSLERLSLGAAELQLFSPSFSHPTLTPSELTAVYDGTAEPLIDLVKSHCGAREVRLELSVERRSRMEQALNEPGREFVQPHGPKALSAWPVRQTTLDPAQAALEALPHYQMTGIRQRLSKVHLIGLDPHSPMAGVPIPVASLDALRAGSVSPHSYLACCLAALHQNERDGPPSAPPSVPRGQVSMGATHIRYSTRRFGLRPVETTASQLRVFVQELAADRVYSPETVRSQEVRDPLAECLLAEWGVGDFACLQISWAPKEEWLRQAQARASLQKRFYVGSPPREADRMGPESPPTSSASPPHAGASANGSNFSPASPSSPRTTAKVVGPLPRGSRLTEAQRRRAMAAVVRSPRWPRSPVPGQTPSSQEDVNGGWPTEHKDVWTDEAVDQPAELHGGGLPFPGAGSPPGHDANGSGAERLAATATGAFRGELAEGIRQNFGWDRAPPWEMDSSFMQRLRRGELLDPQSRDVWIQLQSHLGRLRWASGHAALAARNGGPHQEMDQSDQSTALGAIPRLDPEPGSSQLHFSVHVPAEFMRLGGIAAFTKRARLDCFLDNIARGEASWS